MDTGIGDRKGRTTPQETYIPPPSKDRYSRGTNEEVLR
jgi:hypothetical protein